MTYTFTRAGTTNVPFTVNFTVSGSAAFTTDYTASFTDTPFTFDGSTGTVTFAANATTISVTQGVGTITDDDPLPTLGVRSTSIPEGVSGTTNLVFTVTLSVEF